MPMVRGCERAGARAFFACDIDFNYIPLEHGIVSRVSRPFFSSCPTPQRSKGLLAQTNLVCSPQHTVKPAYSDRLTIYRDGLCMEIKGQFCKWFLPRHRSAEGDYVSMMVRINSVRGDAYRACALASLAL